MCGLEGPWAYTGSNSLTAPADTASAADFSHIVEYTDLDANHVGGDVSWTPPEGDASIETYETYLATDAAGSGGVLAGGVAVGTNVYAVLSDTDSTGKSHIVVYTKSVLVEQTTPASLALTDVSKSVSAVSFGDLDLDALQIGGGLSFTPPGNPSSLAWGWNVYIAKDSAGSGRTLLLSSSYSGSNSLTVAADTASAADFSHIVVYTESSLCEQTVPAATSLTGVSKSVSVASFEDLDLDANHVGGDVSWTPPEGDAGIEAYETYLATDAAGSGGALAGSTAVGTNVYAVSSDTDSTGQSHIVVYTKSLLAEQTTPAASSSARSMSSH